MCIKQGTISRTLQSAIIKNHKTNTNQLPITTTMTDRADSVPVPVATTLSLSEPTCSRKGDPPFVVTITHRSTAPRPIWALVYRFTDWVWGIEVRDLEHHHRRGPSRLWLAYAQFDEDPDLREDTSLERLEPGQSLEMAYTFSVERKFKDFPSDVHKLQDGQRYEVTLRKRRWWWMFEDEMPMDCTTDDGRRRVLGEQTCCVWKPECVAEFEMVE